MIPGFNTSTDTAGRFDATQIEAISKALEAGNLKGGAETGQTNIGALKLESLDRNLKTLDFTENELRFYKKLPKGRARNTVEEYNQLLTYGGLNGGFISEGALPNEADTTYARKSEVIKYIGQTGAVTIQTQLVDTSLQGIEIYQKEVRNRMLAVLRIADNACFYGDAAQIPLEFNGFYAQHLNNGDYSSLAEYFASDFVIDLRGAALTQESLDNGVNTLIRNHAMPNYFISTQSTLTGFAKSFHNNQRVNIGQVGAVSNAIVGQEINMYQSQFGKIDLDWDIYAERPNGQGKLINAMAESMSAPATPVAGSAPNPLTDTETQFGDGAGTYRYAVSARNANGESALVALGGVITVTATQAVDLTFTAGSGTFAATSYRIYRTRQGETATTARYYPILDVPVAGSGVRGSLAAGFDGAAAMSVRDRNRILPSTSDGMLLEMSEEVVGFKTLGMDMMKIPIARIAMSDRFIVSMFCSPFLFAPRKMVKFINIGLGA